MSGAASMGVMKGRWAVDVTCRDLRGGGRSCTHILFIFSTSECSLTLPNSGSIAGPNKLYGITYSDRKEERLPARVAFE